jgi:archaellum component FlaC
MRIERFILRNFKGIEHIDVKCGSVVIVSGENAAGKSSIIDAFSSLFEGGHDPDEIRRGADRAEITVLLDDGTTLQKLVKPKSTEYCVTSADGSTIPSPTTYIKKLVTGLSLNPTGLVDAAPKERVKFLQNAMPLEFTRMEVAPLCEGYDGPILPAMDVQQFNNFRQGRYDQRTDLNRKKATLDGAIQTLRRALPSDEESDWIDTEQSLADAIKERRSEIELIHTAVKNDRVSVKEAIQRELDAQIAEIRRKADAEIEEARLSAFAKVEQAYARMESVAQGTINPIRESIESLTQELGQVREKSDAQKRAQGTRKDLDRLNSDIKDIVRQVAKLDRTIDGLDALKREKLDALPIQDVEVRDGQIYYRGLNFDTQCNTALKYLLSFQVAALTLGDLKFMIFDGAESLDGSNRADFIEAIKAAGFQVVMAEVRSGEPLKVEVA